MSIIKPSLNPLNFYLLSLATAYNGNGRPPCFPLLLTDHLSNEPETVVSLRHRKQLSQTSLQRDEIPESLYPFPGIILPRRQTES